MSSVLTGPSGMIDKDAKHEALGKSDIAEMENPDVERTCTYSTATSLFVEIRLHIGVRKNISL